MEIELFKSLMDYGLVGGLLAAILWGGLRLLRWVAPRVDACVNGHLAFMERTATAVEKQTQILERGEQHHEEMAVLLRAIHECVSALNVSEQFMGPPGKPPP